MLCFGEVNRLARLSEGGVEVNVEMRPQLLYELSKMDGAIINRRPGVNPTVDAEAVKYLMVEMIEEAGGELAIRGLP